jgi:vacuolar-type H+-ATPase subunit I/STV1
MNFDRQYQQNLYDRDDSYRRGRDEYGRSRDMNEDAYRRQQSEADRAYRDRRDARSDYWDQYLSDEQRRQFLASLGRT